VTINKGIPNNFQEIFLQNEFLQRNSHNTCGSSADDMLYIFYTCRNGVSFLFPENQPSVGCNKAVGGTHSYTFWCTTSTTASYFWKSRKGNNSKAITKKRKEWQIQQAAKI